MPGSLPSGWSATGDTATFDLRADLELRAQTFGVNFAWARFDTTGLWFTTKPSSGASDLGCSGLFVGSGLTGFSWSSVDLVLLDSPTIFGPRAQTILATGAGACTNPGWLGPVALRKTIGPLRLGVTIQNDVMRYGWFSDSLTLTKHFVAGVEKRSVAGSDPPTLSSFAWSIGPNLVSAGGVVNGQGELLQLSRVQWGKLAPSDAGQSFYTHVRFSNFTADIGGGAVAVSIGETTEYTAQIASGSENGYELVGGFSYGPEFQYRGDIAADETSGAAVAADATWEGARVCPANFVVTKPLIVPTASTTASNYNASLGGHQVPTATLADPWLSAQTVRPYTADQSFRFEGQAPAAPGTGTQSHYSAGSITIASSLSVLQSANAWTITLGAGSVGGTSTVPVFTITTAPASVERNLAESWRDWNTASHGDYQPTDLYTATKRDAFASGAGDDRWGASLYSFLDCDLTVPAGDDTVLAVAVTWAYQVAAGSPGTIDTIEVTYSDAILTFPAGARNTRRVDLMFPVELQSRPFYGERVDRIRLIGLKVGVTTVHALNLVTAEQAYITLSGRSELLADSTTRHTGIVIAQDGAAPSLLWGQDQAIVPTSDSDGDGDTDARGDHQNGRMVENGMTNVLLGKAPGMRQSLLADTFAELHRMEGITATYSDTALQTALGGAGTEMGFDTLGNPAPVPRVSTWFKPLLPHARITAGTPYDVRAQFVVSGIVIPCGLTAAQMRIFQRNHLGQVLEGLATDASFNRHGGAVAVNARGYTGGAPATGDTLLGTGSTDASGYVFVPVRTGTLGATGLDISSYFTGS